jgi:hypothetical protein
MPKRDASHSAQHVRVEWTNLFLVKCLVRSVCNRVTTPSWFLLFLGATLPVSAEGQHLSTPGFLAVPVTSRPPISFVSK